MTRGKCISVPYYQVFCHEKQEIRELRSRFWGKRPWAIGNGRKPIAHRLSVLAGLRELPALEPWGHCFLVDKKPKKQYLKHMFRQDYSETLGALHHIFIRVTEKKAIFKKGPWLAILPFGSCRFPGARWPAD